MKLIGIIPARGGSKAVPGKNIKLLAGKELIRYTIEVGLACGAVDELIVSTDDDAIADVALNAGAKVPFMRPLHLATDKSPTFDVVLHVVSELEKMGRPFDAVLLLQPTCPFRNLSDLQNAIDFFAGCDADSLVSVQEVPQKYNPHWVFEPIDDTPYLKIATGEGQVITRRQDLPKAFYRDGSIYLTRKSVIMQQKSLYGHKIAYCITKGKPHINIDTMDDWEEAERLLAGQINKDNCR